MPFQFPLPALGSIVNASSGFQNALETAYQNKQSRAWSERMYQRQYDDSLKFWNLQNEYNSPQQQMNRFKAAGLNPHLVVSQGNPGNASAISTPNPQKPDFKVNDSGNITAGIGADAINQYYDLKMKDAQIDNIRAQNQVIQQEAVLKAATIDSVRAGTRFTDFKYNFENELRETSADFRKAQLGNMLARTDYSIHEDARRAALTSSNLMEAAERMAKSQIERARTQAEINRINQQLKLMRQDGELKRLEIGLKKMGVTWSDPLWARLVGRELTDRFGMNTLDNLFSPTPNEQGRAATKGSGFQEYFQERDNGNYGGKYIRRFKSQ